MARVRRERESGVATLGSSLAAKVRLIVHCKACGHQAEPDVAEQAARHGADLPPLDSARRLRCSACGGREVDFVVSGARR